MRKLALHASALNDAEYELYTESLKEIVLGDCDEGDNSTRAGEGGGGGAGDDAYYERMTVGVREARAWLRGRYSSLSAGVIDGVLRLFSPTLAIADTLSGEEFFAALRLVIHAETGKEPERSLVFVQAHPTSNPIPGRTATRTVAAAPSPVKPVPSPRKRPAELPPPPPPLPLSRRPNAESIPPSPTRPDYMNPFSTSAAATHSHSHPQPPLHPSQRPPSNPPSAPGSVYNSAPASAEISSNALKSHTAHNPFVSRTSSISTRSEDGNMHATRAGKIPPLPPRKPSQYPSVPVGSDPASISGVTSISASTSKSQPPPPPPPRHVSSRSRNERSLSPSKIQQTPVPLFPPPLESSSSSGTAGGPPPKPPKPIQLVYAPSTGSSVHSYTTAYTSPPSFPSKSSTNPTSYSTTNTNPLGSKLGTSPNVFKPPSMQSMSSNMTPASTHNTSPLIKHSLQASKVAHAVKKAEEQLEKERVMRVLKSSSSATPAGGSYGARAAVAGAGGAIGRVSSDSGSDERERRSQGPPLPIRRHQQQQEKQQVQQPSPPMSTSSLEQVVLAGADDQDRVRERDIEWERERERERDSDRERERERVKSDPPPLHPGRRGSYHRLVAQANALLPSTPGCSGGAPPGVVSPFEAVYGSSMNDEPDAFAMTPSGSASSTPFSPSTESESPTFPNARVWRSKSLHHPSSPTVASSNASHFAGLNANSASTSTPGGGVGGLVPPPRRKRPESVQVLPNSSSSSGSGLGLGVTTTTLGAMFGTMGLKSYGGVGSRSPSQSRDNSVAPGYGRVGMSHNRRSSLSATPTRSAQAFSASQGIPNSQAFSSSVSASGSTNTTSNPNATSNTTSNAISTSTSSSHPAPTTHPNTGTTTMQLSDSFHRTLASLQPRLDQARYKAEAGLSRRGYIKTRAAGQPGFEGGGVVRRREDRESREGLMGSDGGAGSDDEDSDDGDVQETRARLRGCGTDDEEVERTMMFDSRSGRAGRTSGDFDVRVGGNTNARANPNITANTNTRRKSALGPSYDDSDSSDDDGGRGDSDDAFVDAPEGMSMSGVSEGRGRFDSRSAGTFDSRASGPFDSRTAGNFDSRVGGGAGLFDSRAGGTSGTFDSGVRGAFDVRKAAVDSAGGGMDGGWRPL